MVSSQTSGIGSKDLAFVHYGHWCTSAELSIDQCLSLKRIVEAWHDSNILISLLPSLLEPSDLTRLEHNIFRSPVVQFNSSLCFLVAGLQPSSTASITLILAAWYLPAPFVLSELVFWLDSQTRTNGAASSPCGYVISRVWDLAWLWSLSAQILQDIQRNRSPVPSCLLGIVSEISLDLKLSKKVKLLDTTVLTLRMYLCDLSVQHFLN